MHYRDAKGLLSIRRHVAKCQDSEPRRYQSETIEPPNCRWRKPIGLQGADFVTVRANSSTCGRSAVPEGYIVNSGHKSRRSRRLMPCTARDSQSSIVAFHRHPDSISRTTDTNFLIAPMRLSFRRITRQR